MRTYNWICHAYCLMGNHFHLLIETIDPTLSNGMRYLNGIYTQSYNKRHKTIGHVFQGRFNAFLIEKETYLLEVSRYIVLNPVRAGLVHSPGEWEWSNYRATAGLIKPFMFLDIDYVLGCFSGDRSHAQLQYISFIEDGINRSSPFEDIKHGCLLGFPQFVHFAWECIQDVHNNLDIPREQRMLGRLSLMEIFADVSSKKDRNYAIHLARYVYGYSNVQIARFLGRASSTISEIVNEKNR